MGKYRFNLVKVLEKIERVRTALMDLAISIDRPSSEPWYGCAEGWEWIGNELAQSLDNAASDDEELREFLYQRAIKGFGGPVRSRADYAAMLLDAADSEPEQRLHPKVKMALDFIKARGPVKAIVVANHIGVSSTGFRSRYVPKLKALGVRNDGHGDGYYFPTE
jgi:hypothetical protein